MSKTSTDRAPLLVSVGAVVENMSTVTDPKPPALNIETLRATDPAALRVLITLRRAGRVSEVSRGPLDRL